MRSLIIRAALFASAVWVAGAQSQTNSGAFAAQTGLSIPAGATVIQDWIDPSARGLVSSNPLTGQPYSVHQETQTVQTLADGTHITSGVQKVTMHRDSQGRTRTERTAPQPPGVLSNSTPPVFIEISDPVSGYLYSFDSAGKKAYRSSLSPVRVSKTLTPRLFAAPGMVSPQSIVAVAPLARASLPPGGPEIVRDQLGTRTIEGVLAEGVRTTTTFPVGAFGNDRPITTVNETWMSPDLGMPVLTKMSDPRTGETTMKLINIARDEPAASLFQPPADYEIVDPQNDPRK